MLYSALYAGSAVQNKGAGISRCAGLGCATARARPRANAAMHCQGRRPCGGRAPSGSRGAGARSCAIAAACPAACAVQRDYLEPGFSIGPLGGDGLAVAQSARVPVFLHQPTAHRPCAEGGEPSPIPPSAATSQPPPVGLLTLQFEILISLIISVVSDLPGPRFHAGFAHGRRGQSSPSELGNERRWRCWC